MPRRRIIASLTTTITTSTVFVARRPKIPAISVSAAADSSASLKITEKERNCKCSRVEKRGIKILWKKSGGKLTMAIGGSVAAARAEFPRREATQQ